MKTIKSILLAVVITLSIQANAQKRYSLTKSTFEVAGTSNIHDWVMRSSDGTGSAILTITDSKLTDIKNLSITLPAESIKSSKTSMDDVAYETLDTKTHKNIKYVLKSADKVNETTWILIGTFTIAGVSKDFKTQAKVMTNDNDTFVLQGSNRMNFTDFEMTPPSAALGVVRAGKEITVLFNITLTDFARNENVLVIK
ncbi:YceI-like domain-containing protein [Flavobacterium resistens]|uniref:YceI family protein n=1 Tax=Flavobacterium resistens TaxID=443612 RepID=A0A521CT16_9FLAO|nr:YceI family protein [Flavobacterium resistens]MRX66928.1 YceI family protein [Flavobacterium resistens]SMO62528.1 YceI-like domain-containing protein [Flavobacterium resistens]